MLVFVYAGKFDRIGGFGVRYLNNSHSLLTDLMPFGGALGESDIDIEKARHPHDVDMAMFEIANYFDIPTLREHIAQRLVDWLFQHHDRSIDHTTMGSATGLFQQDFFKVLKLFKPYVQDSMALEKQEGCMVHLLIRRKLATMNAEQPYSRALRIVSDKESGTEAPEAERTFNASIRAYAREDTIFAMKLAQGLEDCLDEANNCAHLSKAVIRNCALLGKSLRSLP